MNGKKKNFERFESRAEAVSYWNRNSKRPFPEMAVSTCDGKNYIDILEWLFDTATESEAK